MTVDEIAQSDAETIQRNLSKKVGHKLKFSPFAEVAGHLGRGQVYPSMGRLITEDEIKKLL